MEEFDVVLRRP